MICPLGMAHSSGAMLVSGRVTMCNYGWKRCVTRATTKATDHLSIQPSPNSKTKRFTGMLLRKSYKPREDNTPEISQWNSTWTWNTGNLCKHDTLLNTKRPPKTLRLPEFSLFTGRGHMFPQKKMWCIIQDTKARHPSQCRHSKRRMRPTKEVSDVKKWYGIIRKRISASPLIWIIWSTYIHCLQRCISKKRLSPLWSTNTLDIRDTCDKYSQQEQTAMIHRWRNALLHSKNYWSIWDHMSTTND